jgi:hypothetical protein
MHERSARCDGVADNVNRGWRFAVHRQRPHAAVAPDVGRLPAPRERLDQGLAPEVLVDVDSEHGI